jgi:hypothetical protein
VLNTASKIIAILGTVSAGVLGWLHFGSDTRGSSQERIAVALETLINNPGPLTDTPEAARETLLRLGDAAQSIDSAARAKGYTDLPPVLITEDPVWVALNASQNWTLSDLGQVSFAVSGFNAGQVWVRFSPPTGNTFEGYALAGTRFQIEGSPCAIILETVDTPNARAGVRMSCPRSSQ